MNKNIDIKDRIRGCLIGGAAGDALGYAVEFKGEDEIFSKYGKRGITEYSLRADTGLARISDDTQMTMFTAAGILNALTDAKLYGGDVSARRFVMRAYLDWHTTQEQAAAAYWGHSIAEPMPAVTWLMDVPELYSRRAPGNSCLTSLEFRMSHPEMETGNYITNTVNGSKGCGAVMRAAPVGMVADWDPDYADMESAEIGAITHGDPLGYLPAMLLSHIINRILWPVPMGGIKGVMNRVLRRDNEMSLRDVIIDARDAMIRLFGKNEHTKAMAALIDNAIAFAGNTADDLENIHLLGQGWVGDEALAIAVYCCLRHEDSFSDAIIAAVNHMGDSDSTGAIAGNIMGALYGYESLEDKWKQNLELSDVILELADDMAAGAADNEEWRRKYVDHKWKEQ